MEANAVGMNTADHGTNNLQPRPSGSLRRSNSSSSAIGRLSCSFQSRFHTNLNEGTVNGNVSQVEHVLDQVSEDHGHHSSITIPISVGASTENGVSPSQLIQNGPQGQASSSGASLRRLFSFSGAYHSQLDAEVESRVVSEAGDSGDRALSRRGSQRECPQFFLDEGDVYHIPDFLLKAYGFLPHVPSKPTSLPPIPQLTSEIAIPQPVDAVLHDKHVGDAVLHDKHEEKKELPPSLEYIACLVHLAVFGILGVLTRSVLQKLFGPGVANVTSDQSILYLDLPSNMIGSFLMGWFGVVFKADISRMSDQLAIGLSTGYLGSLTTFSGWNQKMLDLSIRGHWVFAFLGFVIGLFLAAYSIIIGVETAKGFRWLLRRAGRGLSVSERLNNSKLHLTVLLVLILIWGSLWVTSGILEKKDFKNGGRAAQLWLACLVGPFGVWIRWWLARLNGRGVGKAGRCKWIPFGTLIANVSAACLMAALATAKKAVKTKNCDTVATGIQFGLLGCLSTVSTLMAEFNAMRLSSHPWRAYVYAIMTIGISFGLGTLIYSVPVWTKGYK